MMHHLAAHIEADNIKYNEEKYKKTFECKLCQFKSTNQPDIIDHMIRFVEIVLIPTGNEITATIGDDLESENETDDAGDYDNLEYLCEGFDEYGNLI